MMTGSSNRAGSLTRSTVSWKLDRGPKNGMNCFGKLSLEDGQSRVPAPPHMMTGVMRLVMFGGSSWG